MEAIKITVMCIAAAITGYCWARCRNRSRRRRT